VSDHAVFDRHQKVFARLVPPKDHRDPVDRLIIAQAIAEKTPVISSDRMFEHYRKQGLDFIHNKR
jgi:PIN domain nuclease of toxin-antitoxin system